MDLEKMKERCLNEHHFDKDFVDSLFHEYEKAVNSEKSFHMDDIDPDLNKGEFKSVYEENTKNLSRMLMLRIHNLCIRHYKKEEDRLKLDYIFSYYIACAKNSKRYAPGYVVVNSMNSNVSTLGRRIKNAYNVSSAYTVQDKAIVEEIAENFECEGIGGYFKHWIEWKNEIYGWTIQNFDDIPAKEQTDDLFRIMVERLIHACGNLFINTGETVDYLGEVFDIGLATSYSREIIQYHRKEIHYILLQDTEYAQCIKRMCQVFGGKLRTIAQYMLKEAWKDFTDIIKIYQAKPCKFEDSVLFPLNRIFIDLHQMGTEDDEKILAEHILNIFKNALDSDVGQIVSGDEDFLHNGEILTPLFFYWKKHISDENAEEMDLIMSEINLGRMGRTQCTDLIAQIMAGEINADEYALRLYYLGQVILWRLDQFEKKPVGDRKLSYELEKADLADAIDDFFRGLAYCLYENITYKYRSPNPDLDDIKSLKQRLEDYKIKLER